MDKAVAHPGGSGPRNLGLGGLDFRADRLGGLADDLDKLGQCKAEHLVAVEAGTSAAGAVTDGLGRGLAEVPNADFVFRPHREDVLSQRPCRGSSG